MHYALLTMLKKLFSRKKDLTEGNIVANVIRLAFPLVIGSFLHSTQSLIDMFWVGRLGSSAIAAVALSGIIMMFVFVLAVGLGIGTISLVSKNIGADNKEGASIVAAQTMFVVIIAASIIAVLGGACSGLFLKWLGADAVVLAEGKMYLTILLLGNGTILLLFLGNSILQGTGDMVKPMIFMGIANIINIVVDPICIFGIGVPRMGTAGAAVATVIGQGTAALLVFNALRHRDGLVSIRIRSFRPRWNVIRDLLSIGVPSSLQMFFRSVMSLAIVNLVAGFGTAAVAGFGIVMRIHLITSMPAFALGWAASTLVGQNMGAGQIMRAKKSAWVATGLDVVLKLVATVIVIGLAPTIIGFFSKDAHVIAVGVSFIRITAPFYVFLALSVVLNRALGGAGDTKVPMMITLFCLLIYLVPMAYFLAYKTSLGLKGVWWAYGTSIMINGILILGWFETGHWKKKKTVLY